VLTHKALESARFILEASDGVKPLDFAAQNIMASRRLSMNCPACDHYIVIEDWTDDEPFNCPHCNTLIRLLTDEGGYCGASDKFIEIQEEEQK